MAENAEYIDKHGRPSGRISSQAGLNAFVGGRIKTLPSVPSPGQPGSRFNAVVVDRGERMSREEGVKAPSAKSLPVNTPPGMIQGVPSAIMNQTRGEESEQTVAGAAAQGFAGGFIAGAQMNLGERVNLGDPVDLGKPVNLHSNPRPAHGAPVRNADGQSLADLTAPAPGEDPLPGTAQPLVLDALDAVQGIPPRRAAKGVLRAVTMHPDHVAGLKSLESRHEDSLESAGSHFGR